MKTIAILLGLTTALLAQQRRAAEPQPDLVALQQEKKSKDNWQRMKECAAEAEKYRDKTSKNILVLVLQNHYSPKYEKCYVLIHLITTEPVSNSEQLIDPFEGGGLTMKSIEKPQNRCWIYELGNGEVPCKALEDYVTDHLYH
jgi:hypothetical protein